MKTYLFTSARLGFRDWLDSDILPFSQMNADPEVMAFFPNVRTQEESIAFITQMRAYMHQNGYCFFAVDELATDTFVGFIGMKRPGFDIWFKDYPEIGWRLRKEYWNRGLATEGAKRCLTYGFETLGFSVIYSYTAVPNRRSERVMQKIGMELVETFDIPVLPDGHWLQQHVLYKIEKPS